MAVSAFGLGTRAAFPLGTAAPRVAPVSHLVIDTRFAAAVDIARQTAPPGAKLIALPRDVLGLWYQQLLPALQTSPQRLAGVTTEYGFFTLQTLAADQRLRARITATYDASGDAHSEALICWEIGPATLRI